MRLRSLVLSAALLILPLPLLADTIYTYTGNDYTNAVAPYTTSESINVSFTVASSLADNLSNAIIAPTSISFSDGVYSIGVDTISYLFKISTDASGNIDFWDVRLAQDFYRLNTYNYSATNAADSVASSLASNQNHPGTWTSVSSDPNPSPTPEPSSIALLGTGALGLAGMMRRRFMA